MCEGKEGSLLPEQQLLLGTKLGEHLLRRGLRDTVVQSQDLRDDVEIFRRAGGDTGLDQEVLELVIVAEGREAVVLLEERDRLGGSEGGVGLLLG